MRLIALALSFISTSVLAVPYEFTGKGFQLLRDQNYKIICYSNMPGNCDVDAGEYTLFDYSTNPATVTTITIDAPIAGPMIVSEFCEKPPSAEGSICSANCPSGKLVTQVLSCSSIEINTGKFVGSGFRTNGGNLQCQSAPSTDTVEMAAKVVCE